MRSEKEMMDLILEIAQKDERVRGVYMNGSRTNIKVKKDLFQDYDIVYVVTETMSFIKDENWIDVFGKCLYMQLPDKMSADLGLPCDFENRYGHLIQLADGNRLDLQIRSVELAIQEVTEDALCIVLLDKDNNLPQIPPAHDQERWVKKPSEEEFLCCCNEFWWLFNNVGKGLWRKEIPYVMDNLNSYIRPELIRMISWEIGIRTDFSCSVGKSAKYMNQFMTEDEYICYLSTYPQGEITSIWEACHKMMDLFSVMAHKVKNHFDFLYNEKEAHNSRLFFETSYRLPEDAKTFVEEPGFML